MPSLSLMFCPFLHLLSSRGAENFHFAAMSTHRKDISNQHLSTLRPPFHPQSPIFLSPSGQFLSCRFLSFGTFLSESLHLTLSDLCHLALSVRYAFPYLILLLSDYVQCLCPSGFSHYFTGLAAERAVVLQVVVTKMCICASVALSE